MILNKLKLYDKYNSGTFNINIDDEDYVQISYSNSYNIIYNNRKEIENTIIKLKYLLSNDRRCFHKNK